MKKVFKAVAICMVLGLSFLPFRSMAGPGFQPVVNDGGVDCPIDGGLSLLAAAGIGYGAKKFYDAKQKQKQAKGDI